MTQRLTRQLVFHGALLVLVGMCVGFPFAAAITEGWGPESVRAWRVAHTSLVLGGALYLAIAAVSAHLVLGRAACLALTWSLVGAAYVFASALILGASVGARGLEPGGPPLHALVFALFATSLAALFAAVAIVAWGAFAGLRETSGR